MISIGACKGSLNPLRMIKTIRYKLDFMRNNPDYFDPDGLCVFVGPQGSGKTLSAVNYVHKLMEAYPKCKLVTNVHLEDYPVTTFDEWYAKRRFCDDIGNLPDDLLFEAFVDENRVF